MSKKDLKAMMEKNLARDAQGAPERPRRLEPVIAGAPYAPLDIAKPMAGLAREIALDHIEPDPNQPRKSMDGQSLKDLAASMKENGVLQAITVTWSEESKHYQIIAGHRRVEAARLAGLSSIPAIIRPDSFDERRRLQEQLVENIQRENLPPIDEARAVQTLIESQGLSQRDAAQKLGKPLTYINELLAILRIDGPRLIRAKDLPKRALVEIARGKNDREQEALLKAALQSKNPWQEVKRARTEPKEAKTGERGDSTFKAHYRVGDTTVTVAIEKNPDQVTRKYVVKMLQKLIENLRGEEAPRHGKAPPRG